MKVFRKTALLISVLVLAVVLSVGAIAGAALLSEGETLGEVYNAVRVTTDGKVNLKVYYSSLGDAEAFVAEVVDPASGETTTYNYTASELEQDATYGYCVKVPLAPSEMTHTVKVWATAGDTVSTVREFTVVDYANDVLATESLSDYHDAMRALLNWGAMAQTKFNDATTVPANVDLFERGSNSVYGVNSIAYTEGSVTNGTTITGNTMDLSLEPGNIAIMFYVNYTGEGTLTATVSKNGGEAVETDITSTAKGWLVKVANVPATLFDTPYTVTVTDGTDTFTATKTIREYLGILLAQCNDNGDLATGNTVRALYQFYQILTGETGAADCAHNQKFYYWVADGADTSSVRCNQCHTVLGAGISNDVNAYAHAGTLQNVGVTGQLDKTLKTEDGVQFVRYDNFYANRDNWGDISIGGTFTGVEGVTGQYLVIKYRTGAEGNSQTVFQTFSNTNKGSETGLTANGLANIVASKDDQWHTVIINLAERVKDPSITFVDEGDGTYNVRYLSIRAFAGGSKVETDDAEGRYAYTYVNAAGTKYTVYGAPLTEDEMAEKGYTELVQINKTSVSADAYLDLAYVALCDSEAEAKSLIDTAEYEWSVSNTLSAYRNPADDTCTRHQNAVTLVAGENATVYTAACQACGTVAATQTVPNTVNYFADYSSMNVYANTGAITKSQIEDGVIFNRYTFSGGCHANITGGGGAGSVTSSTYTTGKYVTFKYRWIDKGAYMVLNVATGDKKDGNGASSGEQSSANVPVNEWRVAIVDVSGNAEWTTGSAQQIYTMFTVGAGTLDIAYYAVVDSYEEAATLMGPDDEYMYDYGTSFASTTPVKRNNKGECLHGNITETLTDTACTYTCGVCGEVAKTITLTEGVEIFFSASNMNKQSGTSNTTLNANNIVEANVGKLTPSTYYGMGGKAFKFEDETPYFTFTGARSDGVAQFIWMRSMQDVSSASAYERYYIDMDQAKYIVIKARASADTLSDFKFYFSTSGTSTSQSVVVPMSAAGAEEWGVYVVDMSTVLSSCYVKNAETGTYELDCFYLDPRSFYSTDRIDLAYIAFVEDWADVDSIVDEETVFNLTDRAGGYNTLNVADHTCIGEHEIVETTSGTTYTIGCSRCSYVVRSYDLADINWYAPLSGMNKYTCTLEKNLYDSENGVFYNRFSGNTGNHFNLTGGSGAGSATSGTFTTGKYVAIKYRVTSVLDDGTAANHSFGFNVATGDKKDGNGKSLGIQYMNANSIPQGEWRVAIVDASATAQWTSDGTAQSIYMMVTVGGTGNYTFDVAWLAVVDSVEEMKTLLADGETYYDFGSNWANTSPAHLKQDGTCVAHTQGDMQVIDGVYKFPCTGCGTIIRDTGVKADAVGLYWSAEELYVKATQTGTAASGNSSWTGTMTQKDLITEDGETFLRLGDMNTNKASSGAWGGWFPAAKAHTTGGKYMVIKVRQNDNSVNVTSIPFWITSTQGYADQNTWAAGGFDVYLPEDGQWHVIVVDLSVRASSGYTADANGDYLPQTVHMRPFGGYTAMDNATDEIMDIAYIAFFDDLANLKDIIAEDTFEMSQSASSSLVLDTETLGCAVHNATESVSGNTYTYTCTVCGQTVKTVELDSSVTKYYSANVLNTTAKVYYGGSGNTYKYDADANVGYMETSRIQTIWQRMDHDMAATQTAGPAEQYTENVGNAKYLVVKARSSDAAAYLRFNISTTAKNCQIGTITEADFTDGVLNATKATYKKILEDGSTDTTPLCSEVGDQYYHGSSMKEVYLMATGAATGEWVTYVIDLEAVCGEYYAKVEGQDYYDVDTFYFHNAGTNDIAYAAFVEGSWAEIDALVEEDVVMQITAGGSSTATVGKLVYVADGSDAE